MPKQKDLKRLVRSRMRKTGESYTAARSKVVAKKDSRGTVSAQRSTPAREPDLAKIAGMSDETLKAKTGKTWKQWVLALDRIDAASLSHRDIASRVVDDFDIPGWWAQTVTVGYERIRGLREKGQRRGGGYEVGKSKTYPVPIDELFNAWSEPNRKRWLGNAELRVRKSTPRKSIRITWSDGTPVEAYFLSKGEKKSLVAVQHRGLASRSEASRIREFWTARLLALDEFLAGAKSGG